MESAVWKSDGGPRERHSKVNERQWVLAGIYGAARIHLCIIRSTPRVDYYITRIQHRSTSANESIREIEKRNGSDIRDK